jgi:hypothetical protein
MADHSQPADIRQCLLFAEKLGFAIFARSD